MRACMTALLLACAAGESPPPPELDYGDYRGRWCVDDHGYVHGIGQVYYPSPTACPCTCTEDGPVCIQPTCARIHPRCTRISYKACCPVCEAVARVCVYRGRSYRVLEEFRISRCERCRCGANRQVYCSVSACPAPHCVNPTYDPHHCCPVCRDAPVTQLDLAAGELPTMCDEEGADAVSPAESFRVHVLNRK
uniref:Si:dkey-283b1.7 n=1 Tax=Oryzias sinensis TaxID=183150 RepID=A0A8C7YA02_9TELE